MRNLFDKGGGEPAQAMLATLVRRIFVQPGAAQVDVQFNRVIDQLTTKLPATAEFLIDVEADLLAFSSFPHQALDSDLGNNLGRPRCRLVPGADRGRRRGRPGCTTASG